MSEATRAAQATQATPFLKALFAPYKDGLVELRALGTGTKPFVKTYPLTSLDTLVKDAIALDGTRQYPTITFGVLPRTHELGGNGGAGKKEDVVSHAYTVWVDVDGLYEERPTPNQLEHALHRIEEALPDGFTPRAVVCSGHGLHLYFVLDEALPIATIEEINRALAHHLVERGISADPQSTDAARVMRIPCTTNLKSDPPIPCTLIKLTEATTPKEVALSLVPQPPHTAPQPPHTAHAAADEAEGAYPPCIREMMRLAREGVNLTHTQRFTLVSFLHRVGWDEQQLIHLFSNQPDYDPATTSYQISHIIGSKDYTPPSCTTLQSQGYCINRDELCAGVGHPLTYLERAGRGRAGRGNHEVLFEMVRPHSKGVRTIQVRRDGVYELEGAVDDPVLVAGFKLKAVCMPHDLMGAPDPEHLHYTLDVFNNTMSSYELEGTLKEVKEHLKPYYVHPTKSGAVLTLVLRAWQDTLPIERAHHILGVSELDGRLVLAHPSTSRVIRGNSIDGELYKSIASHDITMERGDLERYNQLFQLEGIPPSHRAVIAAWALASPFFALLKDDVDIRPDLVIWGENSTGKSHTARLYLQALYGTLTFSGDSISSEARAGRLFSACDVPLVISEFDQIREGVREMIKNKCSEGAYMLRLDERGGIRYNKPWIAPVCYVGNDPAHLLDDAAIREGRVITLHFAEQMQPSREFERVEAAILSTKRAIGWHLLATLIEAINERALREGVPPKALVLDRYRKARDAIAQMVPKGLFRDSRRIGMWAFILMGLSWWVAIFKTEGLPNPFSQYLSEPFESDPKFLTLIEEVEGRGRYELEIERLLRGWICENVRDEGAHEQRYGSEEEGLPLLPRTSARTPSGVVEGILITAQARSELERSFSQFRGLTYRQLASVIKGATGFKGDLYRVCYVGGRSIMKGLFVPKEFYSDDEGDDEGYDDFSPSDGGMPPSPSDGGDGDVLDVLDVSERGEVCDERGTQGEAPQGEGGNGEADEADNDEAHEADNDEAHEADNDEADEADNDEAVHSEGIHSELKTPQDPATEGALHTSEGEATRGYAPREGGGCGPPARGGRSEGTTEGRGYRDGGYASEARTEAASEGPSRGGHTERGGYTEPATPQGGGAHTPTRGNTAQGEATQRCEMCGQPSPFARAEICPSCWVRITAKGYRDGKHTPEDVIQLMRRSYPQLVDELVRWEGDMRCRECIFTERFREDKAEWRCPRDMPPELARVCVGLRRIIGKRLISEIIHGRAHPQGGERA